MEHFEEEKRSYHKNSIAHRSSKKLF